MAEYLIGSNGEPIGPDLDALSESERAPITACLEFVAANIDRVKRHVARVGELGKSGADTVVVMIDVDDPTSNGAILADILMPGHDWQQYRDTGQTPVASGWVPKEPFSGIVGELGYGVAAQALIDSPALQLAVLHAGTIQLMEIQLP